MPFFGLVLFCFVSLSFRTMPRRNNFTPPQRLAAPTRTAQRLQIRGFLQAGCRVRETAQNVGCAPSTVQIWKKRFKNAETEEDKPHTGRPVTITLAKRNALLRTQNRRGQSTRKLAAKHQISKNTVHRTFTFTCALFFHLPV